MKHTETLSLTIRIPYIGSILPEDVKEALAGYPELHKFLEHTVQAEVRKRVQCMIEEQLESLVESARSNTEYAYDKR